jgi:hypothetical protein
MEKAVTSCKRFPKEIGELLNEFCDHYNVVQKKKTLNTKLRTGYNSWLKYNRNFYNVDEYYAKEYVWCRREVAEMQIFENMCPDRFECEYEVSPSEALFFFSTLQSFARDTCIHS